ncbi:MAG: ribonuclease PH [Myxococcota bacterium]|jgi:ribonuclease PH
MRLNNRTAGDLRPVKFEFGFQKYREGSVLVSFGDTRVLCSASREERVPPFLAGRGSGWVTAEYSMLPGSTLTRSSRERGGGPSGRTHEIQRLIGRSLRAVTDLRAFPDKTVHIDCDVLQADGGTRTASITGACLALESAFRYMKRSGILSADPLRTRVAAVSVGIVRGEPMLDLDYEEDSTADVDMNLVMTGTGGIVEIQGTAEREPFSDVQLETMMVLARRGISDLLRMQSEAMA